MGGEEDNPLVDVERTSGWLFPGGVVVGAAGDTEPFTAATNCIRSQTCLPTDMPGTLQEQPPPHTDAPQTQQRHQTFTTSSLLLFEQQNHCCLGIPPRVLAYVCDDCDVSDVLRFYGYPRPVLL